MKKDARYFNFPIQLISGFPENTKECLNNISFYAIYEHSLKLEEGNELVKMIASAEYLGIALGDSKHSLIKGKELYDSIDCKSPKTGLNVSIWWDFYENNKTEFEKVCLLGFLALKSIIQKKAHCKTNNKLWLARMDGKPKLNESETLSDSILKYANEYQTKKIKTELKINWGLISYSRNTRGFYISFKMNIDSLVLHAETQRYSNKIKKLKTVEQQAVEKALLKIKNNTTNARP